MSDTNACAATYTDPALTYVDLAFATLLPYADQALQLALEQAQAVQDFEVPFQAWDASFAPEGDLVPVLRPERPEMVAIDGPPAVDIPEAPSATVPAIVLAPVPAEPDGLDNPPVFTFTDAPAALDVERPGDAPTMSLPTAPEAPVIEDVAAPVLVEVVLPDVPDITIPTFTEEAPVFDATPPDASVNFVETPYASALLTQLRTTITAGIDGTYYLPAAVAAALWDTTVQREDQSSLKLEQEARDMFASMGYDEPSGPLTGRMLEVKFQNRAKRGELNRQVYIRQEEVALENLRFFVQQGMGYEQMLLTAHLQIEERKFQMAVKLKELALSVFNAHVAQYNAAINAYNSRVDAYRAYLDGLRTEVDIYRAQVDAAKVSGEINTQRVQMYAEQVRAGLARADVYRAQVEGFKASIEAEKAVIDGFRAEVDAYSAQVSAHATEWEAYRTQVMAKVEEGKMYETLARVHGTRMEAYRIGAEVQFANQRGQLAGVEAQMRRHDNQIKVVGAQLDTARALMASQTATNESLARMYQADAGVEETVAAANARAYQAATERARANSELMLRDADLQIQQLLGIKGLLLESMKSAAQSSSQLAASSLSAFNVSTGISSSQSRSKACSTNFSYSGEIIDA